MGGIFPEVAEHFRKLASVIEGYTFDLMSRAGRKHGNPGGLVATS